MKIYTRTGDDGTTGMIGGARTHKNDPRIDSYGTVDELNSVLGWAAVASAEPLVEELRRIQGELFVMGSHLATPNESRHKASLPPLTDAMIQRLESQIDLAEASLAPLRNFILPGGSELASRLHVARTVCRRAERLIVAAGATHELPLLALTYLNRLSDWLFVQARAANQREKVADIPWVTKD